MGTFNLINATTICPRCHHQVNVAIELKLGDRKIESFSIGDKYFWRPRKSVQNGGRPPNGTIDGDGYTECPECLKDFFINVIIKNDIIVSVHPNTDKSPYIADNDSRIKFEFGEAVSPIQSIDELLVFLAHSELGWPHYFQRLRAIEILGNIGNPKAIDVLKEVVRHDVQEFDAWGLGEAFSLSYFAQKAIEKIKANSQ